jgi:hypothetical protein
MSPSRAALDLSLWLAAEREQAPPTGAFERDFVRLAQALAEQVPPLAIGSTSLATSGSLTVKVVGSVAVGVAVGVTAATGARYAIPDEPVTTAVAPAAMPAPAAPPRTVTTAPAAVSASSPDTATAPEENPQATPAVRGPKSATPARPEFDAELELIELAKKNVNAGQPHLATVWLAEHRRRFPSGVFVPERRALEALVACAQGSEQGPRLAAELQRLYPGSVFLDRVRRACGSQPLKSAPFDPSKK